MATIKAKWKRAPKDQRRLTSDRTIPNARFARRQRSRSLPRASREWSLRPLLIGGLAALAVAVIVIAVIAVGAVVQAQQQYDDLNWRAHAYGLPTQPFATPDVTLDAPDSQFPAFAAPDDPRWTLETVTPLAGSADLYSIPTAKNNQPIQTLSAATTADVIASPDWGEWAQIRMNGITAWIDTSTVQIEAAS